MEDLFIHEQQILDEAEQKLLQMKEAKEPMAADYEALLKQYKSLLKQIRRIVRISDRTAKELCEDRNLLFEEAQRDALTGIYNRRFLNEELQHILDGRTDGLLSVLMLDIDFFKKYNDTYGHDAGDKCLLAIAAALAEVTQEYTGNGFAARYGGEEFLIALPDIGREDACGFTSLLLARIRGLNIEHEGNEAGIVTISAGVVSDRLDRLRQPEEWIRRADQALYESKQNGRDQYTLFRSEKAGASEPGMGKNG